MVTERFTVVALPHSVDDRADHHVALFVSPQLTPDTERARLRRFPLFLHWTAALRRASFELLDQAGAIPATPLLDRLKPRDWDAIFPSDTPVRGPRQLNYDDRHWRTFRAGEVHDAAKVLHLTAMFADPTSPPAPSMHPLSRLLGELGVENPKRGEYDESRITRVLDSRIGETGEPIRLEAFEREMDTKDGLERLALQVHRARRFYERPEAATGYREHPADGARHRRPPRPEPDFHERCSLIGDHPALQRRLGLVIDLVVDDLERLRESEWLSGRIAPQGHEDAGRGARTRCRVAGKDLVTVSSSEDWTDERLRLGDPGRFQVLDMDPDGSALKVDRFLWTIPRLLAIEENEDPVHAAPTALRSIGFTAVRHKKAVDTQSRMQRQRTLAEQVTDAEDPLLHTEDVTHGMRVEVWDDEASAWFTLHARRITARVRERGNVAKDLPEDGFIQTTTLTETPGVDESPVHVHESVFGWEGWSLSATRPGKRVRHEDGEEIVEPSDTDPDPVTPLIVTAEAEPGTLPRLRYGRSYAFRAWAVNLGGDSRAHRLGAAGPPPSEAIDAAAVALTASAPAVPGSFLIPTLRSETVAGIMRRRFTVVQPELDVTPSELSDMPDPAVVAEILGRLRERRLERLGGVPRDPEVDADRASLVSRAFSNAVLDEAQPFIVDTALRDAGRIAAAEQPDHATGDGRAAIEAIAPIRPFLRWDPVPPPAVVARHRFTAGESLRQLVVRSGVTQDIDTLEIHVQPPDDYAAAHAAVGYRATSQRHLAPPKTSQSEAELHGAFDRAIGSGDRSDHRAMLAVALREAGSFFDVDVPRLQNPQRRDPQRGIALEADPTFPPSEAKQLPFAPGEMPAAGQYVVHDVDALRLPYLPDVLAHGIALIFPDAGRDRSIAFPFGTEGFTARYRGDWPEHQPFRLVLRGADMLSGALEEHVLRVGLPPGDVQRIRLASALRKRDLDLFGVWRSLPPVIRDDRDVAEAAADGWLWALTPFDELTLVHAVPRPLEIPRPTRIVAVRPGEAATDVYLAGAVDVHGPSSEMITAEARWKDPVDDLTLPGPDVRRTRSVAFTSPIRERERLAVLWGGPDHEIAVPGGGRVWLHQAVHRLGDTKHHTIRYRFRASTRFREYFDGSTLAPVGPPADEETPADDGQSVVGPEIALSVPSSARPAEPIVRAALPLFRWHEGTEREQPVARRHRRLAGVRLYLDRPWYSSGDGELLGVLIAPFGDDSSIRHPVSQWGGDPVWASAPVPRAMFLELESLLRATGLQDRPSGAFPVVPPATLPLSALPGSPQVTVLGYRPRYRKDRAMWYVDVAIRPGSTFWPFVRLALARYQPDSIAGCHLSAPVLSDFVQLTPRRTASVSRTDVRHVRVVVSGSVGMRSNLMRRGPADERPPIEEYRAAIRTNRIVVARLQRRDPAIPTDLGWQTVVVSELIVRGFGRNAFEAAWVGELEAPEDLPLRTPGDNPDWRVTIEEWERLPGDPADLADADSPPVWEQRLVYADEFAL